MPKKELEKSPATNPASPDIPAIDPAREQLCRIVAERTIMILTLAGNLIPNIDLLKDIAEVSDKNYSKVQEIHPFLQGFGKDPEASLFYATMNQKRAHALLALVEILKDTEADRVEFEKNRQKN